MKNIKAIVLTCLVAMSIPASAQKIPQMIDQAFDDFISSVLKDDYVTASHSEAYTEGYYKEYAFAMPAKRGKVLDKLNENMKLNSRDASSSLMKKAGGNADTKLTVMYGENRVHTRIFGSKKENNYNVQVFNRNAAQPGMQTAYALVWKKSNDSIFGTAFKIYSKDPTKGKSVRWSKYEMDSDGTVTINGKPYYKSGSDTSVTVPKTSADFLQQFTNLSTLFKSYATDYEAFKKKYDVAPQLITTRTTFLTGAANKIMRLCKEYGNVLDKYDRGNVKNSLMSLKGLCTGDLEFLSSMFLSAEASLK